MEREAKICRTTKETQIELALSLDGGAAEISTGIGFFDHMLTAFSVHGNLGLTCRAKGDLEVDAHHTVEDTGIVLGIAFNEALGDKTGIARYGSFYIPMDEALAFCAVDISARPYLVFDVPFQNHAAGGFDYSLIREFFRAFAFNAGLTLHIRSLYGENDHHIAEAVFKAVGHALCAACAPKAGTLSTKGIL